MRLSPLDPEMYRMQAGIAMAHLFAGRYRCCVVVAGEGMRESAELPDGCEHRGGEPCAGEAGETRRREPWIACVSSIRRCAFPRSKIGFRSTGQRTSLPSRRGCGKPVCRNKSSDEPKIGSGRTSGRCLELRLFRGSSDGRDHDRRRDHGRCRAYIRRTS